MSDCSTPNLDCSTPVDGPPSPQPTAPPDPPLQTSHVEQPTINPLIDDATTRKAHLRPHLPHDLEVLHKELIASIDAAECDTGMKEEALSKLEALQQIVKEETPRWLAWVDGLLNPKSQPSSDSAEPDKELCDMEDGTLWDDEPSVRASIKATNQKIDHLKTKSNEAVATLAAMKEYHNRAANIYKASKDPFRQAAIKWDQAEKALDEEKAKALKRSKKASYPKDIHRSSHAATSGRITDEQAMEVLGLQGLQVGRQEIALAYRALSQQYHPDMLAESGEDYKQYCTTAFSIIDHAYKRLLDKYPPSSPDDSESTRADVNGNNDREDSPNHPPSDAPTAPTEPTQLDPEMDDLLDVVAAAVIANRDCSNDARSLSPSYQDQMAELDEDRALRAAHKKRWTVQQIGGRVITAFVNVAKSLRALFGGGYPPKQSNNTTNKMGQLRQELSRVNINAIALKSLITSTTSQASMLQKEASFNEETVKVFNTFGMTFKRITDETSQWTKNITRRTSLKTPKALKAQGARKNSKKYRKMSVKNARCYLGVPQIASPQQITRAYALRSKMWAKLAATAGAMTDGGDDNNKAVCADKLALLEAAYKVLLGNNGTVAFPTTIDGVEEEGDDDDDNEEVMVGEGSGSMEDLD